MKIQERSILVCDDDETLLAPLRSEKVPGIQFMCASSAAVAQHHVANRDHRLVSICINPEMGDALCVPLIRFCRSHRPAVPISLCCAEGVDHFDAEELRALNIHSVLRKPILPAQLVQALIPTAFFDVRRTLGVAEGDAVETGEQTESEDGEMHAIDAVSFLCGSTSFFDVYVKVGTSRFLKILRANDRFDEERVKGYLAKGVEHFYIKREAQLYFLQYCERLTEAILRSPRVSLQVKQRQVQNLGKETFDALRSMGLSVQTLQSAQQLVRYAHNVVSQMKLKDSPQLVPVFEQLRESDHASGTALVTAMLLNAMGFRDEDTISTVTLGAFLHDLGMFLLPVALQTADVDALGDTDREEFEKHPLLGARAVQELRHLPPLVPQILAQHHDRRSRRGFPLKLGAGGISPNSEMVGIADLFQDLLARTVKKPQVDPLWEIERRHFQDFSLPTVEVFRKVFLR